MNRGICESISGAIYIADYRDNPERSPVSIYCTKDLENFDVAWQFPAKSTRHVHAIVCDPTLPNRIWVLTGDLNHESGFYYTDDHFNSLHCFLQIGQETRATDFIIREDMLYWGMDSPTRDSYLLSTSLERTGHLDQLLHLPGPAYYMLENAAGGMYVGTAAESGSTRRVDSAHIVAMNPDETWHVVHSARRDAFPQHGIFYFPNGVLPENFIVFAQRALTPHEGYLTIARDRLWG
jgi:hypothetical protein